MIWESHYPTETLPVLTSCSVQVIDALPVNAGILSNNLVDGLLSVTRGHGVTRLIRNDVKPPQTRESRCPLSRERLRREEMLVTDSPRQQFQELCDRLCVPLQCAPSVVGAPVDRRRTEPWERVTTGLTG